MIFDSFDNILPGLLPSSFRGVPFFVPDTETEVGRRVAEHLFPGVDAAAYDDLGLAPAIVNIEGMIAGGDYILQAQALKAAFEKAGPGTLIHPWLGPMQVIMDQPAEISFTAYELRIVRFSASFKRYQAGGLTSFASTASLLISVALAFVSIAAALSSSPSHRTLSRLRTDATQRSAKQLTAYWSAASGQASAEIRSSIPAAMSSTPVAFASGVATITDSIVNLVPDLSGASAVSPAAEAPAAMSGLSARQALDLCAGAGAAFITIGLDRPSKADTALMLGAAADALARAAQLSAYVDYSSRSEALALRSSLVGKIDAFVDGLGALYDTDFAAEASTASRAARDVRLHLIADINESIGRLPATLTVATDRATDAFQIANHIYGDNPSDIEDGYQSIIERNRPRHPASLPAGRIEVIQ